ncbi:BTAD domain-containing putative transcriptional regulator [Streptomyces sp. NPDC060235]|uniref:AfsR/SARP family transcriptional regulator n=1 Tax=Streptomyces sp. NPDC060235 TaxID=3347080 RepID=UPI00365895B3
MLFRILGDPDFLTSSQRVVAVKGKKMEFMGMLLLRSNETVSLDRIVEGVWGDRPPKSAVRNVRTYAWSLRNDLDREAHRLSCSPGGYRFSCDQSEFDLAIFQTLAADGLQAARAGNHEASLENLRRALLCWRGAPFGGVTLSQYLQAEVDWMTERRLSVFEALMDALLELGFHQEVVERAGREIVHSPLREGLHEKLVRSLVMSGRPSEALMAYRRAKGIFEAELGVEPGGSLRRSYEEIMSMTNGT